MRRFLRIFCLGALLAIISAGVFFAYHGRLAHHIAQQQHFNKPTANAFKHAYAAAQLFKAITAIGVADKTAEEMVAQLGFFNERLERLTKFHAPDPVTEMMKDLANNHAGIIVAQCSNTDTQTLQQRVVELAKNEVLVTSRRTITLAPSETSLLNRPDRANAAIAWFLAHRTSIAARVRRACERTF